MPYTLHVMVQTISVRRGEDKKWYDVRLRVTENKLQVWLDDKMVIDTDVEGRKVSMRFGEIEMSVPFGICTYATTGVIRDISIKKLN